MMHAPTCQIAQADLRPLAAGDQAGGARREPRRGLDVADALAQRRLDPGDGGGLIRRRLGLVLVLVVFEQRDGVEIDVALAQGLQRLATRNHHHGSD